MGTLAVVVHNINQGKLFYALIWYLFFNRMYLQFPILLHKERTKYKQTPTDLYLSHMLMAHRGGSWESPENTLAAFQLSIREGA